MPVSATTTPTVNITSPTNGQVFTSYLVTVSGTASDTGGQGLAKVTVTNTTSGSTGVEPLSGTSASYALSGIVLVAGQNVIDVQGFDKSGYRSIEATVTVTYSPTTWTGGGSNADWSNADNWGGIVPVAGSDLVFAAPTGLTTTNDLAAGTQFGNLTFNAGAGTFTLNGNSVNLSGTITNNSANTQTINLPLGGTNGVTKAGAGIVVLSGASSYTGGTVLTAGTLTVTTLTALPEGSNLAVGANVLIAFGRVDCRADSGFAGERNRSIPCFGNRANAIYDRNGRSHCTHQSPRAPRSPFRDMGRYAECRWATRREQACPQRLGRAPGRVRASISNCDSH